MEALDENNILDQEWMNIADLIQKSLGSTWRLAVKTDNKKYNKQRNVKKWNKKNYETKLIDKQQIWKEKEEEKYNNKN